MFLQSRHKILTLILSVASFFTVFVFVFISSIPKVEAYAGGEAWDNLNGYILEYENAYWYSDLDLGLVNLSENPEMIHEILLGINNFNLEGLRSIGSDLNEADLLLAARLSGRFLLAVEDAGRLWYLNPVGFKLEEINLNNLNESLSKISIKLADFGSYNQDVWTSYLLELVNTERLANNLFPLELDLNLAVVAYDKAKEMFIHNYFAHIGPNALTPGQRLNSFTYPWLKMGENLAIARKGILSPEKVFQMWMESPGHKENILKENYTHIGLAFYNNFWVQEFVQR